MKWEPLACSVHLTRDQVAIYLLSVFADETDKVATTISPQDAIEGDTVLIECRANGNPAPKVTLWIRTQSQLEMYAMMRVLELNRVFNLMILAEYSER